ncbi:MAG: hypothetical protein AAFQ80_17245 [Cyanobacteria bacterium J06621_8]
MSVENSVTHNQARSLWWQKLIAMIALVNLFLVIFNLSYLPLRDIYLRYTPAITQVYDPLKGIEPHPDTEAYLATVAGLERSLNPSDSFATDSASLLADLRQQSLDLIAENPFLSANKSATFAQLKHRMEYHLDTRSTTSAFARFWSQEYLSLKGTAVELGFFSAKIKPLLETNYYRRIDANGLYLDNFWRIDIWFIVLFAVEYLGRTFWVAKQREDLNWWDTMWRYWYDALMLIPFWRWLRVIPVAVRIHKTGLFNLEKILAQITHEPAAYISNRASTFLIVRLLNQSQDAVNNGAIALLLSSATKGQQVGEADKIDKIIDRLISLTIYQVLPQVQPDLEDLLRHSLKGALKETDAYQTVKTIPGITSLPQEAVEQLADYLAQSAYDVLVNSYSDEQGKIIFDRLSNNFSDTLKHQLKDQANQSEIQVLLSDLLEEWKINYVKSSQQRDPEATLAETEKIISSY